jgi:hypothetical protein
LAVPDILGFTAALLGTSHTCELVIDVLSAPPALLAARTFTATYFWADPAGTVVDALVVPAGYDTGVPYAEHTLGLSDVDAVVTGAEQVYQVTVSAGAGNPSHVPRVVSKVCPTTGRSVETTGAVRLIGIVRMASVVTENEVAVPESFEAVTRTPMNFSRSDSTRV